jgi:hypothetical protein
MVCAAHAALENDLPLHSTHNYDQSRGVYPSGASV